MSRYSTELMEQILTSPAAQDIVSQLAPIYGEGRVALWLFQVIGAELDTMGKAAREVQSQVVPHTATWSLDYWEDEYGIPRDPTLGTEKRRERILSYLRNRAPMNPVPLARIASSAAEGATCRIEERTGAGSVFTVWIDAVPSEVDKAKIMAAINRAKQARLSFLVKYEQHQQGASYIGGHVQMSYDITIRQVV
mgnify:FL=1